MVSFTALRVARRAVPLIARSTTQQPQRRGFSLGGHHGPPPKWEGIDKVVRGYFPEDYQRTCRPFCSAVIPDSVRGEWVRRRVSFVSNLQFLSA